MKPLLILSCALALSACQTTRFVTVPCISEGQELPSEPDQVGDRLTGQAQRDFQIVAANNVRLRVWGGSLRHIIEGCRG